MFRRYVHIVRPLLIQRWCIISEPEDPLWLRFDGQPQDKIGKLITAYFKENSSLHMTSTNIRAMVEMAAEDMKNSGKMTMQDREAVANTSGHRYEYYDRY